jgi:hypothetical protein
LTIVDCWWQGRSAFGDGHYRRTMRAAEAAQMTLDETLEMQRNFPVPVVPDHIWGNDVKEEAQDQLT